MPAQIKDVTYTNYLVETTEIVFQKGDATLIGVSPTKGVWVPNSVITLTDEKKLNVGLADELTYQVSMLDDKKADNIEIVGKELMTKLSFPLAPKQKPISLDIYKTF